ncbi:MAG: DUF748 domain-containing protein [Pseudomonadota bacterium]
MTIPDTAIKTMDKWLARGKQLPSAAVGVASSPKWQRRAAWFAGGVLLFWALAYAFVPGIAKSQIEKIASDKLGRQVTVGSIDFKPWSLELTVNDLAIARRQATNGVAGGTAQPGSPQKTAQLGIKRIYIDGELQSLLRLAPVADAIEVDGPALALTHFGEGRYDIDDILERLKPAADAPPAGDPQRFALYNIVIRGGQLDFDDQSVRRVHELRALDLSVPFLSNLNSQRDVKTAPRLAFKLNGSSFDTAAEGTPFAQTHKTDATFKLSSFDLTPYLGYVPAGLPFRLQSAVLNADTKVSFEQNPGAVVKVSGLLTADKVRLLGTAKSPVSGKPGAEATAGQTSQEVLAFEQLRITMDDVQPLAQSVKLSKVELLSPVLSVSRDRAGRLNLLPVDAGNPASADSKGSPAAPAAPKVATAPAPAPAATNPWKVQVASVAVRDGRVNWLDDTLASPAQVRLAGVALDASAIAWPFAAGSPLQFSGLLGLDAAPAAPVAAASGKQPPAKTATPAPPARLAFSGTATDQSAQVTATLAAWPLNMASKYIGQFLLPALGGQLDAQLGFNWQAAGPGKTLTLQVTAPQLAVSDILLAEGKVSLVSVKRVDVAGVDIDVTGQSFKAAKMELTQPRALVDRDAEKRWMYERWLVGSRAATAPVPAPTTAASKAAAPSWAVAVGEVVVEGGSMSFSDRAGAKPVVFEVSAFNAQLGGLVLDDRASSKAAATKLMPLKASLRLATGRFEPGKLSFNGNMGLEPIQAQGQVLAERLPAQAFEPYFADILNIELLRADAGFRGRVVYRQMPAGPQAQVNGNFAIEEMKANTLAPSEDLLAWKALNLRGLNVALEPGKATRIDVKETVLQDFFARVIVLPEGRINLQDLVKSSPSGTGTASAPGTATVAPTAAAVAPPTNSATATTGQTALPAAQAGPAPIINFGPISMVNGKVLFSDRFVKPNYSANLSDLTGKLSAFSSVPAGSASVPNMADLELRGRAEGTASLEILGKLNPLVKPIALDITGKVRDLELPPLSPYSVKYSGYGINRGKLSVDVKYQVQPDGKLTASNKVILNQLSFGDKVEGSTASLPVKLAVALLADRNGVIDIDLPISGSLNDPQFSLGPIIIKVILNVIVKAITAPFSLLASAFGGGGDELGNVAFAPGSARLQPEAQAGLDKVAKALEDRPSLRLTVVGTSNLDAEREGFKRARLDQLVRAEKRRSVVKEGGAATVSVTVSPAEYPTLLKEVYKHADMSKPRNLVGMAKDLPVPEMENLLLADIKVTEDAMRELAVQRGVVVKDYLAAKNLPTDRLFLGATKTVPPDAKWTPRAELVLAIP